MSELSTSIIDQNISCHQLDNFHLRMRPFYFLCTSTYMQDMLYIVELLLMELFLKIKNSCPNSRKLPIRQFVNKLAIA